MVDQWTMNMLMKKDIVRQMIMTNLQNSKVMLTSATKSTGTMKMMMLVKMLIIIQGRINHFPYLLFIVTPQIMSMLDNKKTEEKIKRQLTT